MNTFFNDIWGRNGLQMALLGFSGHFYLLLWVSEQFLVIFASFYVWPQNGLQWPRRLDLTSPLPSIFGSRNIFWLMIYPNLASFYDFLKFYLQTQNSLYWPQRLKWPLNGLPRLIRSFVASFIGFRTIFGKFCLFLRPASKRPRVTSEVGFDLIRTP